METLFKAYVYKNMLTDLTRLLRRAAKQIDFEPDDWLHRVGLTTYRPIRVTAGGAALVLLGAGAGLALGLALASKPGKEFRADVKEKARDVLDTVTKLGEAAETRVSKATERMHA